MKAILVFWLYLDVLLPEHHGAVILTLFGVRNCWKHRLFPGTTEDHFLCSILRVPFSKGVVLVLGLLPMPQLLQHLSLNKYVCVAKGHCPFLPGHVLRERLTLGIYHFLEQLDHGCHPCL